MKKFHPFWILALIIINIIFISACSAKSQSPSGDGKLKVVATTTIVGAVVTQVGGDQIDLSVLLPTGSDPHSFDPTPKEIARVADADIVFANGVDLEKFLENLILSADASQKVVSVSDGIDFLIIANDAIEEEPDQDHGGADPHVWLNPQNVMIWVQNIEHKLADLDPKNAATFESNAAAYLTELETLDAWIQEQVAQIPVENRKLVTDHAIFSYFSVAYGFEQVGALIPGYSTLAEPTAQELAQIEDAIRNLDVKAIFVGNTVNPTLAERVAEDTNTQLVYVFTGSLSEPTGNAPTYLEYMRYNTLAFVNALAPSP